MNLMLKKVSSKMKNRSTWLFCYTDFGDLLDQIRSSFRSNKLVWEKLKNAVVAFTGYENAYVNYKNFHLLNKYYERSVNPSAISWIGSEIFFHASLRKCLFAKGL